jgi:hypothetical protein
MLRKDMIALALMALLTEPAFADLQGVPIGTPSLTREETVIIERNATLSEISKTNPWIVRKLFDAAEKGQSGPSENARSPSPGNDSDDPDLDWMQRSSPEAAHDLFQLLKQAGQKQQEKPK